MHVTQLANAHVTQRRRVYYSLQKAHKDCVGQSWRVCALNVFVSILAMA